MTHDSIFCQFSNVARYLLSHCGGMRRDEKLLLIVDETTEDLVQYFHQAADELRLLFDVIHISSANRHGAEPNSHVSTQMLEADVVAALTKMSLAHTRARQNFCDSGGRFLSLAGYSLDLLEDPSLTADFHSQFDVTRAFSDAFSKGSEIRVTTPIGTNISMSIKGRSGNCCPGFLSSEYRLASPPDIEANISPLESLSNGIIVVDGSVASDSIGLLNYPITLEISYGSITNISSKSQEYVSLTNNLFDAVSDPKALILAECGVGFNPLARLTGNMLTDEGAFGCVHFGFGSNSTVGGLNNVNFHIDFVIRSPSLWVDDIQLLDNGHPVY